MILNLIVFKTIKYPYSYSIFPFLGLYPADIIQQKKRYVHKMFMIAFYII